MDSDKVISATSLTDDLVVEIQNHAHLIRSNRPLNDNHHQNVCLANSTGRRKLCRADEKFLAGTHLPLRHSRSPPRPPLSDSPTPASPLTAPSTPCSNPTCLQIGGVVSVSVSFYSEPRLLPIPQRRPTLSSPLSSGATRRGLRILCFLSPIAIFILADPEAGGAASIIPARNTAPALSGSITTNGWIISI